MLGDKPGVFYTEVELPATTAADATSLVMFGSNPFTQAAKIVSATLFPVDTITGDDTDSFNLNLMLANGSTEIGNLNFPSGINGVIGVPIAFTLSGTAAQLKLAADAALIVQIEDVGDQPGMIAGHRIRVGWKRI